MLRDRLARGFGGGVRRGDRPGDELRCWVSSRRKRAHLEADNLELRERCRRSSKERFGNRTRPSQQTRAMNRELMTEINRNLFFFFFLEKKKKKNFF